MNAVRERFQKGVMKAAKAAAKDPMKNGGDGGDMEAKAEEEGRGEDTGPALNMMNC